MRIGIDARLVHYQQAGITQYTLRLLQGLAQIEGEDEFVVLQNYRVREPYVEHKRFLRSPCYTPSHHRLESCLLALELLPLGLDVFHSPDFIPPRKFRYKSVITVHDLNFLVYPHFLTSEAARYYGQIDQAVRRADRIIAVSESTRRDIVRLMGTPESKISVIYEGANPIFRCLENKEELRESLRRKYGIQEDFILFVSTIEPRKNIPTLVRAFRQLLDDYHLDVSLVLAGREGWRFDEVFNTIEELKLEDRVFCLGRVPTADLVWLYNTAKVFAFPSFYEGFGLPPLEAMACGTPVVASNVSSLPEVVGDAGLLVDPQEVDELTVALWRLMSDEELREDLIEKGLRRASTFSYEKMARETLAVYHRLGR
ncbi:MAG: glycosyltransferase family 4 protein [Anaerolineae bacterium]|nr:glycosyltransferase family 4 protein [Anaerolineae bacterium]